MNNKPSHAHHPPQYPPHYPPPQHHRQPPHYPQQPPPPQHHRQPPHYPQQPPPPQHHRQPPHYSQQPPPQHHRQPQQQHRQPPHTLKQPPPQHHREPPHYSQQPPQHHRQPQQQHRQPPHNLKQPPPQHYSQPQPPPPQQHRPPPPPQHPPPPPPHRPPKQAKPRGTTLASCIVATIFLTFLVILLCILYFSLFKPKDPKITITAIEIPTFTVSTNSTPTVSFTFSQYAAVHNPNRAAFHHFDSSLQLLYAGNQVAFMFIPAGNISARNTVYMSATFSVQSFPIMSGSVPAMEMPVVSDGLDRIQPTMEMEVKMEMVGRVRVLWFFTHHVESLADCRIEVAINDGSVLGFHC